MTGKTKTVKTKAKAAPKTVPLKLAPDTSDVWRNDQLLKLMITQLDAMTTAINDLVAVLTPG
jgi:hypothetical protein